MFRGLRRGPTYYYAYCKGYEQKQEQLFDQIEHDGFPY